MNTLRIGLLLLMSATAILSYGIMSGSPADCITCHVGDFINIEIGPVEAFGDLHGKFYLDCAYKVANQNEVFFYKNPAGNTNILNQLSLENISDGKEEGHFIAYHHLLAVKPGAVTIRYNQIPNLENCGCENVPLNTVTVEEYIPSSTQGSLNVNVFSDSERAVCLQACTEETQKQMRKDYKMVTVTVLPLNK